MFQNLRIAHWRQFSDVSIEFHPHLTVLTGANGAGKTTLLGILSRHFGWSLPLISTPRNLRGVLKFFSDYWDTPSDNRTQTSDLPAIGEITYRNGLVATLRVPPNVTESYNIDIANQQQVPGLFVPSHRPAYVYQKVENIPTQLNAREQLLNNYLNELRSRFAIGGRTRSPSFRIKESLISLATFGYGNEVISRNNEAVATFEGYQEVLRVVLPKSLGFRRIQINPPEVVLETNTRPFSFDAVSGGIAALIDITWQLYMSWLVNGPQGFVALIDEPENHLHPELQRSLLPDLIQAFPQVQFIAATHNPFMVTSTPDAHVYALTYSEDGTVVSSELDLVNRAGSANEILRDVLGVPVTTPIWVEQRMQEILKQYAESSIGLEQLAALRKEMASLGLEHVFPQAVARVFERQG
jgi:hypothetical protein